jgi:hypothetical protein
VHARDDSAADAAVTAVLAAYELTDGPVAAGPILLDVLT